MQIEIDENGNLISNLKTALRARLLILNDEALCLRDNGFINLAIKIDHDAEEIYAFLKALRGGETE